jgi:hypothetical protein
MGKQTAIDWFLEHIQKVHKMDWDIVYIQAKAIEKEQIIKAFESQKNCVEIYYEYAEDYYNETYNK